MRVPRSIVTGMFVLALSSGGVGLLVGCSDESKATGTTVEVDEQEEQARQEAMKNFMKSNPAATRPTDNE